MREVSRRELINYVRAVGGYPGYSEAERAVGSVFGALQECLEPAAAALLAADLPPELLSFWVEVGGQAGGSHPDRPKESLFLARIGQRGGYPDEAAAERALLAVFSALKEKLQERAASWGEKLPPPALSFWRRARTVDEQQEASQCL